MYFLQEGRITNVYNTVEFELWSHDQNSITDSDYSLAESIEALKEETK